MSTNDPGRLEAVHVGGRVATTREVRDPGSGIMPTNGEIESACPVRWVDTDGGYWRVERYQDVRAVLSDASRYSSRETQIPREDAAILAPPIPFNVDPPDHDEYARVLRPLMRASVVRPLEPILRHEARDRVGDLSTTDRFEIVDEYAAPVTSVGLARLLGFPLADEPAFVSACQALLHRLPEPAEAQPTAEASLPVAGSAGARALTARDTSSPSTLEAQVRRVLERRSMTGGGLMAALWGMKWKPYFPDRITEVANLVVGVIGAALGNTVIVFHDAVHHLATHAADRAWLVDNPDKMRIAVEEMIRLYPPVSPGRIVRRDGSLYGQALHVGESVLASVSQGNRDPDVFSEPDRFATAARRVQHLGFGAGRHRCVGAATARMILVVLLDELHASCPNYRLVGQSAPVGATCQRAPLRRLWLAPVRLPGGAGQSVESPRPIRSGEGVDKRGQ